MLTKRIIPCLDIKNGKVVKGINFVELKDVGDPIELAKRYDQQCADEVVFLDITASYEERDIIKDIISTRDINKITYIIICDDILISKLVRVLLKPSTSAPPPS